MARVELRGVTKRFGATDVLKGVELTIDEGEFVVFVGPSGCGKSTLLRILAGLEAPTGGEVLIGDKLVTDLGPAERGVAMVFQSYALYPHLSVYENMAFSLRLAKRPKEEVDRAVRAAAETLSIDGLLDRKPRALSGGQRQRVAIGRAIVRRPEVFLFDEPLSNLDAALRVRMRHEFAELHRRFRTTTVYVTHDQVEAMTLADRIVVLSEGRVEQVGAPLELYRRPANRFVASFLGSPRMNFVAAELVEVGPAVARLKLRDGALVVVAADAQGLKVGQTVTLGLRPETPAEAADGSLALQVAFVEALGGATFVHGAVQGAEDVFVVQVPPERQPGIGETVRLAFAPGAAHIFDADGRAVPTVRSTTAAVAG
jgi:ABC-type sugar transport system ATPase subunit